MSDRHPMQLSHQHPPPNQLLDSQAQLPALPEGLPPPPNQLSDFDQSSVDHHTTQSVTYPSTHYSFQLQPEPEPEPQPQPHRQLLTDVAASDTPMFDILMASAAGSLSPGSNSRLLSQMPISTDTDTPVGAPQRARLAAATAQSLMASPTHRTMVAEKQLDLELDAGLRARCVCL